jgi:hypothetical protein
MIEKGKLKEEKKWKIVTANQNKKLEGSLCSMFPPPLYVSPTHDVTRDAPMISLAEC